MGACASAQNDDVERGDALTNQNVKVFVGSWNVGNAPPAEDLSSWLQVQGCGLVVVGAQECEYKHRGSYNSCHNDWVGTLQSQLDGYVLVASHNLMQMRIATFALPQLLECISEVNTSTEATGVGGVVGNKGGVVISLKLNDTRLCFVNSHLAAHQDKTAKRNADVAEIIEGIKVGEKDVDILHQFHHVFWLGDLNYRLDYGDQGDDKTPSAEVFNAMVGKIKNRNYAELFQFDQLRNEMKNNRVFIGFEEGNYNFPPTFKVARVPELQYKDQRSPAWCDRILWRSMRNAGRIVQERLDAAIPVGSSDHKPVFGVFNVPYFSLPKAVTGSSHASITISGLSGSNLPIGDLKSSDPYIVFASDIIKEKDVKTKTKMTTLDPKWEDNEVPVLRLTANHRPRLEMSFVTLKVFDYDATSANDLLANGTLEIGRLLQTPNQPVDVVIQLSRGGLPAGTIQGKFTLNLH